METQTWLLYVEAETKWLTCCRQHFKMQFLERKCGYLFWISLKFVHQGSIKSALVQEMAWRLSGDKPFPEPMLTMTFGITGLQWVNLVLMAGFVSIALSYAILITFICTCTKKEKCQKREQTGSPAKSYKPELNPGCEYTSKCTGWPGAPFIDMD